MRRLLLLLCLALLTSACGEPQAASPVQPITFATGGSVPLAQELVKRYNRALPSMELTLNPIWGTLRVISELHSGGAQIGIAQQADVVYAAYRHGLGDGNGPAYTNLRGVAVLWMNVLTVIVQADGGYTSISDLRGKRIGVYQTGTATEFFSRVLLEVYGMTYADVRPEFLPAAAIDEKLKKHELDATILVTPVLPEGIAADLKPHGRLKMLPVAKPAMRELLRTHPFLHPVVTSARERPQLPEGVETVGIDAVLLCRDDLSEDVVYQLTRELFAAAPQLAVNYAEAGGVDPDRAPATPIPLHPGAARYYREREVLK